jgi:hypothetical protein
MSSGRGMKKTTTEVKASFKSFRTCEIWTHIPNGQVLTKSQEQRNLGSYLDGVVEFLQGTSWPLSAADVHTKRIPPHDWKKNGKLIRMGLKRFVVWQRKSHPGVGRSREGKKKDPSFAPRKNKPTALPWSHGTVSSTFRKQHTPKVTNSAKNASQPVCKGPRQTSTAQKWSHL